MNNPLGDVEEMVWAAAQVHEVAWPAWGPAGAHGEMCSPISLKLKYYLNFLLLLCWESFMFFSNW